MAATFSDARITRWALDYENEICAKHDFIADRISLNVLSGVGTYELPNYVTNIRSILFLGKELHPKGGRASILTGDTPFGTTGSTPYEYLYSGLGARVIKFFPTPEITVAAYNGDLWTAAADEAAVIVEFYRTPDANDLTGLQLPNWFRRYVIKDYVCFKAYSSEGPKQDLRAATYYKERMRYQDDYLNKIKSNMFQYQQNVLYETKMAGRRKPGKPVLPPNFGYPVNY